MKGQSLNVVPLLRNEQLQQAMQNKRVNINCFTILHMIGLGGFSKVFLGTDPIFKRGTTRPSSCTR